MEADVNLPVLENFPTNKEFRRLMKDADFSHRDHTIRLRERILTHVLSIYRK